MIILECIGCRKDKIFLQFDSFPVCQECQEWEEEKFKKEHEETFLIRRIERDVIHDGRREKSSIPPKTTIVRPYISESMRWNIYERDNFMCVKCQNRKFLTLDHIIPVSKGGTTSEENLQTLCKPCNSSKGAK